MGIEGNNVIHSHVGKLLEGQRAIQRLPAVPFVLPALVQKRHHHRDPSCLSAHGSNNPLQILEMIVGRHVVHPPAEGVCQAVIADIHHNKQIVAPDRFVNDPFGLPRSEPRNMALDNVAVFFILGKDNRRLVLVLAFLSPFHQIGIHFPPQLLASVDGNQSQRSDRYRVKLMLFPHSFSPLVVIVCNRQLLLSFIFFLIRISSPNRGMIR